MRRWTWLLVCGVVLACGDDEPSESEPRDSSVADAASNADARVDAAVSDAGARDAASPADASLLAEIDVDRVLPEVAASTNKPVVSSGVADTVATCAEGQFSCNGTCIAADVTAAEKNGCKLIDGSFFTLSFRVESDAIYGTGDLKKDFVKGAFKIALDGSGHTLLAKLDDPSLVGLHDGKLIVSSTTDCNGPGRLTQCLSTVPLTGGAPTRVFPELFDTSVIIAGGKAVYRARTGEPIVPVYERTLFEGAPVMRFATSTSGGLGELASNGSYAFFSRTSGSDDQFLLTKLGTPGTTVQLAKEFTDPYTDVFFAGDYLYMVRRIENNGADYQRLKLGSETGEALAQLPILPYWVVVAGETIYFKSFLDTVDRIYRMPLAGGPITPVATFKKGDLGNFGVGANALYITIQTGATTPLVRVALP